MAKVKVLNLFGRKYISWNGLKNFLVECEEHLEDERRQVIFDIREHLIKHID